jgi:cell division protein FtsQ
MTRSRTDSALLFLTALLAGTFLGARDPGEMVRASLLSGFELESVATRGLSHLTAEEVARSTGLVPGTPLGEIDGSRVELRLLQHPWIRQVRVAPLPPGRVLVEVTERKPVALVPSGDPEQLWLVDGRGTPFAPAEETDTEGLPTLHLGGVEPGQPSALLHQGIRLCRSLEARGLPPARELWLETGDEGTRLALRGVPGQVVLGTGPFPPKLERLARLLSGAPGEVAKAARIDLRFGDRVVLRGSPSADGSEAAVARGAGARPERGRSG